MRTKMEATLYTLDGGDVVPVKVAKYDDTHVYLRDEEGKVRKIVRDGRNSKTYYNTEVEALRVALLNRRRQAARAEQEVKNAAEEKVEADTNLTATRQILVSKGDDLPGYAEIIRKEVERTLTKSAYDIPQLRETLSGLATRERPSALLNEQPLAPYEATELRVLREAFAEYDSEPAIRARVTKQIGDFDPSASSYRIESGRRNLKRLEKLPEDEREPGHDIQVRITRELVEAAEAYEKTDEAIRARVIYTRKTYPDSARRRLNELKSKEEFGMLSPQEETELRITRERIAELTEQQQKKATA
jgi:hypothetical protein